MTCHNCGCEMPIISGHVVDGLGDPSPDVVQEIEGMMEESGQDFDGWRDFLVHEIPAMSRQAEREEAGRAHAARNYYLSIRLNLDRALELVPPKNGGSVLEIGGQDDYPFLLPFRDADCRCVCVPTFFFGMIPTRNSRTGRRKCWGTWTTYLFVMAALTWS